MAADKLAPIGAIMLSIHLLAERSKLGFEEIADFPTVHFVLSGSIPDE